MHDGLDADRGRQMRLTGPGSADEDDVMRIVDEITAVQGLDERDIDRAVLELEAGEIAVGGESGALQLIVDRGLRARRPRP